MRPKSFLKNYKIPHDIKEQTPAMPGVLYLPLGLGHTAYDEYQKDKGVNPCEIIEGGKDPLSGHGVWWNTRVKVRGST